MGQTKDGVLLANVARTTEQTTEWQSSRGADWLLLLFDWTVEDVAATLTLRVEALDPASGKAFTVWTAAAALTAIGKVSYAIGTALLASAPGGLTDVENVPVPATWRVVIAVGDSSEWEASLGFMLGGI